MNEGGELLHYHTLTAVPYTLRVGLGSKGQAVDGAAGLMGWELFRGYEWVAVVEDKLGEMGQLW